MGRFRHPSEQQAVQFLQKKGHIILEHNLIFRIETHKIEVDIISFEPVFKKIHFIEVKSSQNHKLDFEFMYSLIDKKKKWLKYYIYFIKQIKEKIEKYENNELLCLFKQRDAEEIPVSFDFIYIHREEIHYFPQFIFEAAKNYYLNS